MNAPTPSPRSTWMSWAALVTCASGVVGILTSAVSAWPRPAWTGFVLGAVSIPIALLSIRRPDWARHGRSVLVATIVVVGVILMVGGLYTAVLIVLGRRPIGDEREVYALCLVATASACALIGPTRSRLRRWATQVVPRDRDEPETLLATIGGRMTRSVPMDELLLQMVEVLHKTLALSAAEIWTGEQARFVRRASMPERPPIEVRLDPEAHHVAARAQAHGNAWLEMWMPALLDGREASLVRSVSVRHRGDLLGIILLERPGDGDPFTNDEDRILVELARQLGLALHNLRLDSALRASVEKLQERNAELAASRARVVAVADESRRHIERDLHDGAQQHLVALAVKVGLVRSTLETDPAEAAVMIEELADDVAAAIETLRELAHGIYPPRLRDRGLVDALRTAAGRAPCPTTVRADAIGRHEPDIEAAVYFCCLEAMQNAAKYAGAGVSVDVELHADDDTLRFVVADDGIGFDVDARPFGQGLDNMRDRIGAIGGDFTIESSPGRGTVITGDLPSSALADPVGTPRRHAGSTG